MVDVCELWGNEDVLVNAGHLDLANDLIHEANF